MENKGSIKRYIVRDVHGNILDENGLSVVVDVHVTVEPGHGEPSADVEYVGGELYLTLHNIEGNGITEIVTDSHEGDEAVNTVTIKTEDDPEGMVLQVRNGSKGNRGNGITSIETQESQVDGEVNKVIIKTTDNPNGQTFQVRNGRRGPQGLSCLVGEGDLPLDHVLGQDGTKAMSQKGVTDAINSGKISNGETTQTLAQPYYNNGSTTGLYVNSDTGAFVSAAAHRSIELDLTSDMKSIKYGASAYPAYHGGYAFVKDDGTYVSGVNTTSAVDVTADVRQAMAMGATKFRCSINTTSGSAISLTIKKETFSWPQRYESIGDNTNGWMSQRAVKEALSMNIDNVLGNIKTSRYINSSGSWNSTSSTNYASRINIGQYKGKTIKIIANSSYSAEIAFTIAYPDAVTGTASAYYCDGTTKMTIPAGDTYMAVIPDDCVYIYMLDHFSGNNRLPSSVVILDSIAEIVRTLPQKLSESTSQQIAEELKIELAEINSYPVNDYWYISNGRWSSTTANNYAKIIREFNGYRGKQIEIYAGGNEAAEIAFLKALPSAAGGDVNQYCQGTTIISIAKNTIYKTTVPSDCTYLYVLAKSGGTDVKPTSIVICDGINNVVEELNKKIVTKPIVYVSASGSDNNPGTADLPMKTIAAALNAGAADMTVVLMSDTNETVNFAAWNGKKNHVTLRGGNKNKQARIIVGQPLELEQYDNNADVYVCTLADSGTLPLANYTWLWQHGIEDTNTLISAAERHPLQRGRTYRRLSTRIISASSLSALLAASSPCWFLDDRTLYVRTVTGSNISNNPIYYPRFEATAIKTGDFEVTLCNIEAWYGKIIVGELANSVNNMGMMFKAYDCAARYTWAQGAWRIDDGISAYLERCEADSNQYATTGDGFNMHPSAGDTYPYGKGCTHTLVDCWAHDMKDDGYSDHGRSEGTIIGGLYEHNGKGGLAPAIGSHNTIYNTVVRNNTSGILLAGNSVGDGGIGTQIECFGVAAINNTYNFNSLASSSASNLCIMVLNQCISRDARTAALYAHDYGKIISRDTTDNGSAIVKKTETNGVITVDNGTVIS